MALIVLSCVACKRISPMVGGHFFDRHANLRVAQRHLPPALVALVGLGLVVFALTRWPCPRTMVWVPPFDMPGLVEPVFYLL